MGKKILLVDDEEDVIFLFKKFLEEEGFSVNSYTKPQEVISNYKIGYYDLLLVDIRMPNMNGFELVQLLKDKGWSSIKICFITAFEEYYESLVESFPTLDHKCFIKKPIIKTELITKIKKLLQV